MDHQHDIAQLRRVAAAITALQALGCEKPVFNYTHNNKRMTVNVRANGEISFCDGKDFHEFSSLQAIVNAVEA